MRNLLLASVAFAVLAVAPARAAIVVDFGADPTSAAGSFNRAPGNGSFDDQYTFRLVGGPAFLTIASVTNTFAQLSDFISGFTGSVVYEGADGIIGGGDDVTVIGPVAASPCPAVANCQGFAGSALITTPGNYFLDVSGTAGATAGYGGNLSVSQVGAPGPTLGSGLPGVLATLVFGGWMAWKRKLVFSVML